MSIQEIYSALPVAFLSFAGILFSLLVCGNAAVKRRYYPLLVKAGIGIFAAIGIAIAWQKKGHLSMGFLGIALIILVFALLLMADMLSRFKFCGKCGATNMYWFSMMPARSIWYQDRSRCRKCGNPF